MVFPIVFSWSVGEGDNAKGSRFGYLLAVNGVGGVLGAELTQLVILPTCGIYQGFAVVGVLYALGCAGLMNSPWRKARVFRLAAACALIAVPAILGGWQLARIPYLSPRTKVPYKVLDREFGRDGVILVVERSSRGRGDSAQ